MDIAGERKRRANTLGLLKSYGAVEGRDWFWGTRADWNRPAVIDTGDAIEVNEKVVPRGADADALPIMIRSSGVRLAGGRMAASMMDQGKLPAEMPFVIGPLPCEADFRYNESP